MSALDAASRAQLRALGDACREEVEALLAFWLALEDPRGGFIAGVSRDGTVHADTEKTLVFSARLLWTMSECARVLGHDAARAAAERQAAFVATAYGDAAHGGMVWSVDASGTWADTDKHAYAQAFAIYGLTAHARGTGSHETLGLALGLFDTLAARAGRGALFTEAHARDWSVVANTKLSVQGIAAPHTMNTHLHLIEALAPLWSLSGEVRVRDALLRALDAFFARFLHPDGRRSFPALDAASRPIPVGVSFGHDVEAAWLLRDAIDRAGPYPASDDHTQSTATLFEGAVRGGLQDDGSFLLEADAEGRVEPWRVWWTQAEACLAFVDQALRMGDATAAARAHHIWHYIATTQRDPAGEWFWRVDAQGRSDPDRWKVEPWKEPYHQMRACLAIWERTRSLIPH